MKRNKIYPLLVLLIGAAFIIYEKYSENKATNTYDPNVEIHGTKKQTTDSSPKTLTNEFYLPSSTTGQIVHHEGYSLSYNEAFEQAEWVAYELKKNQVVYTDFKRPYFEQDEAVTTESAHWRNYKKSGYDRGHLCPAADRKYTKAAFTETFLTSNISPQKHDFNAGIWNRLEQKVRYWAKKYDGVYVVTGGILENNLKTIGSEAVAVPNYFYKILLDNSGGSTKIIAFLVPHKDSDKPLYEFVVSVDELEKRTGIDFFPELEDTKENKLEAMTTYKQWSFRD
ncbi:DNA/RNA non-specific endonuclease [Kordia algicida OT-1]|uniref:Endonuclease n=1 Tax=Kordia algicida OT-1 TaxID=391587 RepID=A9DK28_9FLAO|nr:DNA/RNA non-specific endonuclease [Kordia algicida]EDP98246.1 putative endonuclease [Kordia algicida OT-1]